MAVLWPGRRAPRRGEGGAAVPSTWRSIWPALRVPWVTVALDLEQILGLGAAALRAQTQPVGEPVLRRRKVLRRRALQLTVDRVLRAVVGSAIALVY